MPIARSPRNGGLDAPQEATRFLALSMQILGSAHVITPLPLASNRCARSFVRATRTQ